MDPNIALIRIKMPHLTTSIGRDRHDRTEFHRIKGWCKPFNRKILGSNVHVKCLIRSFLSGWHQYVLSAHVCPTWGKHCVTGRTETWRQQNQYSGLWLKDLKIDRRLLHEAEAAVERL